MAHKLLDAVISDTTGAARKYNTPVSVAVDGGFGSGTMNLQLARDDNGTPGPWATVKSLTGSSPSTDLRFNIFTLGIYHLRAVLTGATPTTASLTVATS